MLYTQCAIAAVAFFAFLNTLRNQFALDDFIHLVNNPSVRTLGGGMRSFFEPVFPGNLFRPLLILSYSVTYNFFELSPLPYHLTNLLLHTLNAVLVFRLVLFFVPLRTAGMSAFLFAVHPLCCEAVANISGRSELLWSFFALNCLVLSVSYIRGDEDSMPAKFAKFSAVFCSAALAFFSKESAANLVLLLPLILCFSVRSIDQLRRGTIVFAAVILAFQGYLYLRLNALGSMLGDNFTIDVLDNPLVSLSTQERALNALMLLGKYISLILAPVSLSSDYSFAAVKLADYSALNLLYAYLIAVFVLAGLIEGFKKPLVRLFALWFFAAFAVTSNLFFPIGTIFAERLAYLPMVGVLVLIVMALESFANSGIRNALIGLLCMFFVLRTSIRNLDWHDAESLHRRDIEVVPNSAKAQLNYGVVLRQEGDLERAEQYMRKALRTYPAFADAAYNLGLNYLAQDQEGQAREWFLQTLNLNPWHIPALDAMGRLALNSKDYSQAATYFSTILKADPNNFGAGLGFLAIKISRGDLDGAKELFAQLSSRDPKNPELQRLKMALEARRVPIVPPQEQREVEDFSAHVA